MTQRTRPRPQHLVSPALALIGTLLAASPLCAQNAQKSAHKSASRTVASRKAAASQVSPRTVVAVLPVDTASGDSIRVIIARDFDFGDRIRVVPADSVAHASAALSVIRSPVGLRVSLLDPMTMSVRQERDFPLPVVPAPRDSAITDSLAHAFAVRITERQVVLLRYATLADSLRAAKAKKSPHLRSKKARADYARTVATRDSLLQVVLASDTTTRLNARADSIGSDSTLKSLLAHDVYARDSTATELRWAIHGIADEAQQWITGYRGMAQSRVTYVADGELRVVDADGANDHTVTHGGNALSPSWRHDGRAIVYSDMNDSGTQIAWVDLITGQASMLGATRRGLNITPVYSPDDRSIYYANGDDFRTELVAVRTDSVLPIRHLTGGLGFDCVSPVFSPDGSRIAFVSSRPKLPQIYSISVDGSDDRLETPHSGSARSYRTSPDWSPDGRAVAFQQQNGNFQVWSVTLPDHSFRKLTSVAENEDPTWAPDARHIALTSTRGGGKAIWVLDTQSGRARQLTHSGDARLAAWSPLMHAGH